MSKNHFSGTDWFGGKEGEPGAAICRQPPVAFTYPQKKWTHDPNVMRRNF